MTDNDYHIEDRLETARKAGRPNYALRRMKFAIAVIGLVVSVTLMLTWHDSWNMAGAAGRGRVSRHRVVAGGAVRVQGRRLRGVTDEGDSAALAFQSERSGQGRRHEGDDAWRQGGG